MIIRKNQGAVRGRPFDQISCDPHYRQQFTDWHWGKEPEKVVEWKDKRLDACGHEVLPDALVECGRLKQISFLDPQTGKTSAFTLTDAEANRSHMAFDPDHQAGRLYVLLPKNVEKQVQAAYWTANRQTARQISDVARTVGGRHGTPDYPRLAVKPVGLITDFVYTTEKVGDGMSHYRHRAGEVSGIRPLLAADMCGRLWIVGGNYTSPIPGVTD